MTWWHDPEIWFVYKLIDPRDKTIFYVGITRDMAARLQAHKTDPGSAAFVRIRALRDLRLDVQMACIAQFETREDAADFESYLISKTPGLLNRSAPYGKHPGTTPTSKPNWPFVGVEELRYEADDTQLTGLDRLTAAVCKVLEAGGRNYEPEDVKIILQATEAVSDVDVEVQCFTDE